MGIVCLLNPNWGFYYRVQGSGTLSQFRVNISWGIVSDHVELSLWEGAGAELVFTLISRGGRISTFSDSLLLASNFLLQFFPPRLQ